MNSHQEIQRLLTRRHFFGRMSAGIGGAALASVMNPGLLASPAAGGPAGALHFPPKVKRVIWLFMSGGPSHIDLFDYKPQLRNHHGEQLPASIRMGQR